MVVKLSPTFSFTSINLVYVGRTRDKQDSTVIPGTTWDSTLIQWCLGWNLLTLSCCLAASKSHFGSSWGASRREWSDRGLDLHLHSAFRLSTTQNALQTVSHLTIHAYIRTMTTEAAMQRCKVQTCSSGAIQHFLTKYQNHFYAQPFSHSNGMTAMPESHPEGTASFVDCHCNTLISNFMTSNNHEDIISSCKIWNWWRIGTVFLSDVSAYDTLSVMAVTGELWIHLLSCSSRRGVAN